MAQVQKCVWLLKKDGWVSGPFFFARLAASMRVITFPNRDLIPRCERRASLHRQRKPEFRATVVLLISRFQLLV